MKSVGMTIKLTANFFKSALTNQAMPDFGPDNPYRVSLVVAGSDMLLDVDLLEVQSAGLEDGDFVVAQTCSEDVDYSVLGSAVDFFIADGGKMIGRGSVIT